jgi:hypothetical protein
MAPARAVALLVLLAWIISACGTAPPPPRRKLSGQTASDPCKGVAPLVASDPTEPGGKPVSLKHLVVGEEPVSKKPAAWKPMARVDLGELALPTVGNRPTPTKPFIEPMPLPSKELLEKFNGEPYKFYEKLLQLEPLYEKADDKRRLAEAATDSCGDEESKECVCAAVRVRTARNELDRLRDRRNDLSLNLVRALKRSLVEFKSGHTALLLGAMHDRYAGAEPIEGGDDFNARVDRALELYRIAVEALPADKPLGWHARYRQAVALATLEQDEPAREELRALLGTTQDKKRQAELSYHLAKVEEDGDSIMAVYRRATLLADAAATPRVEQVGVTAALSWMEWAMDEERPDEVLRAAAKVLNNPAPMARAASNDAIRAIAYASAFVPKAEAEDLASVPAEAFASAAWMAAKRAIKRFDRAGAMLAWRAIAKHAADTSHGANAMASLARALEEDGDEEGAKAMRKRLEAKGGNSRAQSLPPPPTEDGEHEREARQRMEGLLAACAHLKNDEAIDIQISINVLGSRVMTSVLPPIRQRPLQACIRTHAPAYFTGATRAVRAKLSIAGSE